MVDQVVWLVVIETLEPFCSLWMLLTASARIEQLECRNRGVGIRADRWRSWKVNSWALIILFHYSFGTYSNTIERQRHVIDLVFCFFVFLFFPQGMLINYPIKYVKE
jgi:hypothetical protein